MTKQLYKKCFFAFLVFISIQPASGQVSWDGAASGWDLDAITGEAILTKDGKRTILQNNSSLPQGFLLGAGDMAQTEKGFAELRLQNAPEGVSSDYKSVILRLGENTSVLFGELKDGVSLDLLYGRLHIQSSLSITIRAGASSVFFGECDAIIEYIARPGTSQPSLEIHCLDGEGELTPFAASEEEGAKLPLRKAESLSLEYRVPFTYVERKELDVSVFEPEPEAPAAEPFRFSGPPGEYRDNSRSIRAGNLITGLLLIGAGAAMQGYSHFANPGKELKDGLFYGSFGPIGLGAVFFFGAAAYKPLPKPAIR